MPAAVFSEGAHDIEESHPLLLRGTHALAERYLSLPHVVKRISQASLRGCKGNMGCTCSMLCHAALPAAFLAAPAA